MSGSHSENQTTGKEVMISNQQKEKKRVQTMMVTITRTDSKNYIFYFAVLLGSRQEPLILIDKSYAD
jgi:hypothetical protein